jgi:hypothetical protein
VCTECCDECCAASVVAGGGCTIQGLLSLAFVQGKVRKFAFPVLFLPEPPSHSNGWGDSNMDSSEGSSGIGNSHLLPDWMPAHLFAPYLPAGSPPAHRHWWLCVVCQVQIAFVSFLGLSKIPSADVPAEGADLLPSTAQQRVGEGAVSRRARRPVGTIIATAALPSDHKNLALNVGLAILRLDEVEDGGVAFTVARGRSREEEGRSDHGAHQDTPTPLYVKPLKPFWWDLDDSQPHDENQV